MTTACVCDIDGDIASSPVQPIFEGLIRGEIGVIRYGQVTRMGPHHDICSKVGLSRLGSDCLNTVLPTVRPGLCSARLGQM
jgi:hypothetical protein